MLSEEVAREVEVWEIRLRPSWLVDEVVFACFFDVLFAACTLVSLLLHST